MLFKKKILLIFFMISKNFFLILVCNFCNIISKQNEKNSYEGRLFKNKVLLLMIVEKSKNLLKYNLKKIKYRV